MITNIIYVILVTYAKYCRNLLLICLYIVSFFILGSPAIPIYSIILITYHRHHLIFKVIESD
jgi:hypothetical protein